MKTSIVKIGNSKGVRIPKAFLEEVGLGDEANMSVKDGSIVLTPINDKKVAYNEEYLLSLAALSDWNDPEEDEAWADL